MSLFALGYKTGGKEIRRFFLEEQKTPDLLSSCWNRALCYFASASAVVAQAVAAAEIHWLTPYGKPLSKYA
jgi:hypothetical protein